MDTPKKSKYLVSIAKENANLHKIGLHASLTGEQLQMTFIYMPANAEGKLHSHPQESFVTVLQGRYDPFQVGDDQFVLEPGWACYLPVNALHTGKVGPEPLIEIEVFAPPREDWAALSPNSDFRKKE